MKRLLAVVVGPLLLSGCGADDGAPATAGAYRADRNVELGMTEFAYEPEEVSVARGETVRFIFTNRGAQVHEAVIGNEEVQAEHEEEASKGGMHGGGGDDAEVARAGPGAEAELVYTFDRTGTLLIGCHEPGHYDQGMVATVTVS